MTVDEIYNQIKEYFSRPDAVFAMKDRGKDRLSSCVYRLDNDPSSPVRCVVGCLIPDDLYNPAWERAGVNSLIRHRPDFAAAIGVTQDSEAYKFLVVVQPIHDGFARDEVSTVKDFLNRLEEVYNNWRD
jgi:hypothetical protein